MADNNYFDLMRKLYGGAMLGAGGYGMFGPQNNPSDAANKYISQIPGKTSPYFDPYSQSGQRQLPNLENQYGQLSNDPGGRYNQIGESFKQSPGFKFALEQALGAKDRIAAAQGTFGTPMNRQEDMELATQLANQDYYNYMGGATDLYKTGLGGSQNLAEMGLNAGRSQADMIAQTLAAQGDIAYKGAANKNQNWANSFGQILGGLGAFFGA